MSLTQRYAGRGPLYRTVVDEEILCVAVECFVEGIEIPVSVLLDTGAQWCVLHRDIVRELGWSGQPYDESMSTRFGRIQGTLREMPVRFPAEEGDTLEITVSCFISEEWPGPTIIGWDECLEHIRFALDAGNGHFYFGTQDGE